MSLKSSAEYWWSQYMYQSLAESCMLLRYYSHILYFPHSKKKLCTPTHSTAFVFSASVILPRKGSRGRCPFCNWLPEMRKGVTFVSVWVWVEIIQIPSDHLLLITDQGSIERHCDSENPVLLSGKSVYDFKVLLLYYSWKTSRSKQSRNLLVLVPVHAVFCFLLFLLLPLKGHLGTCIFHAFMQVSRITYGPFAEGLDLMILSTHSILWSVNCHYRWWQSQMIYLSCLVCQPCFLGLDKNSGLFIFVLVRNQPQGSFAWFFCNLDSSFQVSVLHESTSNSTFPVVQTRVIQCNCLDINYCQVFCVQSSWLLFTMCYPRGGTTSVLMSWCGMLLGSLMPQHCVHYLPVFECACGVWELQTGWTAVLLITCPTCQVKADKSFGSHPLMCNETIYLIIQLWSDLKY